MLRHISHIALMDTLCKNQPQAVARIKGNANHPLLQGTVKFYAVPPYGTLIEAEIFHLPNDASEHGSAFFGFHIHEQGDCSDAFQNTGNHYNPSGDIHPLHAGDLPPLLSNQGYAWTAFYTTRITVSEILDRSIVIHQMPDDFTTQPSGDSGEKIACGVITTSF